MTNAKTAALLLFAVLAAGCEPVLFSAEIDAKEICISGLDIAFPPDGAAATTSRSLGAEELGSAIADDLEYEVDILEIGLMPEDGKDLSAVQRVGIQVSTIDPIAELPTLDVMTLAPENAHADGALRSQPEEPVDITVYIEAGEVVFGFEVVGDPNATEAWTGTMDLCVHTRARYSQGF